MTNERKLYLLQNARDQLDCKRYYAEYVELESQNLVRWMLGMALLTIKGEDVLKTMEVKE